MRPKSPFALAVCAFLALGTGALLTARLIGWIQLTWIHVAVATIIGAGTFTGLIMEYFRKPFVREYTQADWTVVKPGERKGVFIKIRKSEHGAGNKPHHSFVDKGLLYGKAFEVEDNNGDLTIYHPENSFTPPMYKSFVIRIV